MAGNNTTTTNSTVSAFYTCDDILNYTNTLVNGTVDLALLEGVHQWEHFWEILRTILKIHDNVTNAEIAEAVPDNITSLETWTEMTAEVCLVPDATVPFHTILLVSNILLSSLILLGNGLTILLIWKYEVLQRVSNLFAVSMAVADMCMGLVLVVYSLINYSDYHQPLEQMYITCFWCLYLLQVSATISNLTLLSMTADRYIAVIHPLRYTEIMTYKIAFTLVFAIWVYTPLMSMTLLAATQGEFSRIGGPRCSVARLVPCWYFFGVFIPHMLLTNVISKCLYAHILCVAKKRVKDDKERFGIEAENNRALMMTAKLVIMFSICWAPYFVFHTVIYIMEMDTPAQIYTALEFSKIFAALKAIFNPIVYYWNNKDFRECFRHMCPRLSRKIRKVEPIDRIQRNITSGDQGQANGKKVSISP